MSFTLMTVVDLIWTEVVCHPEDGVTEATLVGPYNFKYSNIVGLFIPTLI